jgi:hypothetical protein
MSRFLCIVAQDRRDLWDSLRRHFAADESVAVTLDRRRGERRREAQASSDDRRQGHRRWLPDNQETLNAVGAFIVPVDVSPPTSDSFAPPFRAERSRPSGGPPDPGLTEP